MKKIFSVSYERNHKICRFLGIKISVRDKKKVAPPSCFAARIGWVDHEVVHIVHQVDCWVTTVKFLNTFIDHKKHLFIFKSGSGVTEDKILHDDNIIYGNLATLMIDLQKTKKIIMYSILSGQDINFLYKFPQLLKITYWVAGKSDLCNYVSSDKTEFVKSNVKAILTTTDDSEYHRRFGDKTFFKIACPNRNCPDKAGDESKVRRLWEEVFAD